ncbi:MAG: pectate lyase [Polyangiaceae bacterium]
MNAKSARRKSWLAWILSTVVVAAAYGCSGSSNGSSSSGGAAGAGSGGQSASGGATSDAGESSAGASEAGAGSVAVTLNQAGNPLYPLLGTYVSWESGAADAATRLAADASLADNIITWQLPTGGFYKNGVAVYAAPWDGVAKRSGWSGADGVELGTIDNEATVTELLLLADVYRRTGEAKYRDAAQAAFEFLLGMQYPSGGFPQVYPARVGTIYSNYVTFNDDAMARVLALLDQAVKRNSPVAGDVFTDEQRERAAAAIELAVQYILNSQIAQDGVKTVWCAQHDPETFVPLGARSYELASKSGKESTSVIAFLMTRPQTAEVKAAVQAALAWYRSDSVKVADTAFVRRASGSTDDTYNQIQPKVGSTMWYRFYDLEQDVGFFSGRLPTDSTPGVGKQYDLMLVEPERRYGYEWGGSYGIKILAYASSVGY